MSSRRAARPRAAPRARPLTLIVALAALHLVGPGPLAPRAYAAAPGSAEPERVELAATATSAAGRYLLDLPPGGHGGAPAPLLLALHEAASSPEALRAMTGLTRAAAAAGVAVAYPAAAGLVWNDGPGAVAAQGDAAPRDDVEFLRAVVKDAADRFGIDARRVGVVGLGSGGAMALELGCRAPDLARVLLVVNAALRDDQRPACDGANGPSLVMIHGDDDPRRPFGGTDPAGGGATARELGVEATLSLWAARLGCAAPTPGSPGGGAGAPTDDPAGGPAVRRASGCPDGTFAAAVRVAGAGGAWPRAPRDARSPELDAADVDGASVAAALAAGGDWAALLPATPRLVGPAPGRAYDVYVPPSYAEGTPSPLVLVLHGRPGSGVAMARISGMNDVADRAGFIVAYPESYADSWNYYDGLPGLQPRSDVSDLTFFRRLVDRLAFDLDIDRNRLYIAGFSNGGFMTERAACGVSDEFAAFGVVGATMIPEMVFACNVNPTAPVVYLHGTDDREIPWSGIVVEQQGNERFAALPVLDTLKYWTLRNACVFLPTQDEVPSGQDAPTHVVRVRYQPCALGHDVWFYAIQGGGHNWPGVPGVISDSVAGNVSTDINAGVEMWTFFARHPLDAGRNEPVLPPAAP